MMVENFVVTKCPNNELSLKNRLIISPADFQNGYHCIFFHHKGKLFHFTCHPDARIQDKHMGFSLVQRKWAYVGIGVSLQVEKFTPTRSDDITDLRLEIDFLCSKEATSDPVDSDFLVKLFKDEFISRWFARGESLIVLSQGCHFAVTVTSIASSGSPEAFGGVLQTSSTIVFQGAENSKINLIGKSMVQVARSNVINPEFDFTSLEIGGLDEEFKEIFRRAFSTRNVRGDILKKMGTKHVKGILLHGPPGCGKTLTARQIGKMLSVREPLIVNGPEILNKYVGESEANIRKLFEAAEEEQKKSGMNSGLHIIIFDEIDAICKQRGSVAGASGVHDTVVNQLLTKIDGVGQLDNILIIGMTNRPDLIDNALLRPGRLEVKKEIGLPNEQGRHEILKIHCAKMIESKTISADVDLAYIASLTRNFTGAELAGVVRSAQSCAFVRQMNESNTFYVDDIEGIQVCKNDFMVALENDIKPAYGWKEGDVKKYIEDGILMWGAPVQDVLHKGHLLVNQVLTSQKTRKHVSMLLHGSKGSGTTALAARIALDSGFSFVKICSRSDLQGMSEEAKCQYIESIFADAYKSPLSCVVIDNIEKLIDFIPIGPRFSSTITNTLTSAVETVPPLGHKLLVIATSSHLSVLQGMNIHESFNELVHVENLSHAEHINEVLEGLDAFTTAQREEIQHRLSDYKIDIGIKQLIHIVGKAELMEPLQQDSEFMSLLTVDGGLQSSNVCKNDLTKDVAEKYMLDGILK